MSVIEGEDEEKTADLFFHTPITGVKITSPAELYIFCGSNHPSYKVAELSNPGRTLERLPGTLSRGLFESYMGNFHGLPISLHHDHKCGEYSNGDKYCMNMVSVSRPIRVVTFQPGEAC
jgi:hypothetical protein